MMEANRYLVRWRSSITGGHAESFTNPGRAEARLEEVEGREYFESGVLVDTRAAGDAPEEFISRHREHHRTVTN